MLNKRKNKNYKYTEKNTSIKVHVILIRAVLIRIDFFLPYLSLIFGKKNPKISCNQNNWFLLTISQFSLLYGNVPILKYPEIYIL